MCLDQPEAGVGPKAKRFLWEAVLSIWNLFAWNSDQLITLFPPSKLTLESVLLGAELSFALSAPVETKCISFGFPHSTTFPVVANSAMLWGPDLPGSPLHRNCCTEFVS